MVRAPPCHGGGQGFEPLSGRLQLNNCILWDHSSAGRASALQAEGHRFEPYRPHLNGWIPEWPKGTDCKSAATCFGGSNPPPSIGFRKKTHHILSRGGAVWKLVGLITRRSLVQIQPPQLQIINGKRWLFFFTKITLLMYNKKQ